MSKISAHLSILPHRDGVLIELRKSPLVVPADMARAIAAKLIALADQHDPLGAIPLPNVIPKGDPL